LSVEAEQSLQGYQAKVDGKATYEEQVAEGKRLFKSYNRRENETFDDVKRALDEMCSGARRCAFCEDSLADEVEHFRPKDLYPQQVFCRPNYLYVCGPCNGSKNNQFAVFPAEAGDFIDVTRKRNAAIVPPPSGAPVLLNPRSEDATRWLTLDLRGTFLFKPRATEGSRAYMQAEYTIKVLALNRGPLLRARKQAYFSYINFLHRYICDWKAGKSADELMDVTSQLQRCQHPTVWREMQHRHDKIPELCELFTAVPQALAW
jgi:uncharacterized protein (TIGR02646 family)